jgi:hypothetical protein
MSTGQKFFERLLEAFLDLPAIIVLAVLWVAGVVLITLLFVAVTAFLTAAARVF